METQRIRYIYEIKNRLNGKTYIGQHTLREGRTLNTDLYYGSGKLIKIAQRKYGLENFEKRILIYGNFSKEQINRFERCTIACQRLIGKAEYNISDGGETWSCGGRYYWDHASEEQKRKHIEHNKVVGKLGAKALTKEKRKIASKKAVETRRKTFGFKTKGTTGFKFSEESKKKMSEARKGSSNGSFGKRWWTNGKENIKAEICPKGFWKGRILHH